ncbi:hypothetical protein [Gordonia jinhuaensis]|uniref:hypothetical protein n=1 Tax=Gordonia jinhuaensis TaxID=1517702 RepID=UPI001669FDBB|nr:hypothetical protein [Gordonia jinhuaensis]
MLEPQGPLPPEIYWRRRALAVGIVVIVLAVVIGLIVWATSVGGPKKTSESGVLPGAGAVMVTPSAPSQSPDASSSGYGDGYGGSESATPSVYVGDNGLATTVQVPAAGSSGGGQGSSNQSGGGQGADTQGGQSGNGGQAQSTPQPVPASGLCPDQNISVVLYTDKANYVVGDHPTFTLVVTNIGLQNCTRDVGKGMQNVTVRTLDGVHYIWSANDCFPGAGVNNMLLKPGQQFTDKIVWSGTSSNPGCTAKREPVGPGAYQAFAALGERQSSPITFNVGPAPAPANTGA